MSKNPFEKTFVDFISRRQNDKLIIKGILSYNIYEKIGFIVLALVVPAFIYYSPVFGFYGVVTVGIKLFLIVLAFILSRKIVTYLFAIKILEINKENKELKYFLEEFSTKTSDIKEISILEEDYGSGGANIIQYRLQFVLSEGKKTSAFAMTSYNKAQEIIELIKNSS